MADQHERRVHGVQLVLQPLDGRQIEMVGRLVEQEDVGLAAPARGPAPRGGFAARKRAGSSVAGQAELAEQITGAVAVVAGHQSRFDIRRGWWRSRRDRFLRQVADRRARLREAGAVVGLDISPAAILSSVDLPEPLRPTRQRRSPGQIDSVAPARSGVLPKLSQMSCNRRRGGGAMVRAGTRARVRGSWSVRKARLFWSCPPRRANLHLEGGFTAT